MLDLLAACLASGATIQGAVAATATAVDDPVAGVLHQVVAQLPAGRRPGHGVGCGGRRGTARTAGSSGGAGLGLRCRALRRAALVADDLRARRRSEVEAAARRVGVRLTAPLGLAFLPAFVLLGVVPVVASLVSGVLSLP